MNQNRFDAIVRMTTTLASRRGIFRTMAGIAAIEMFVLGGVDIALAQCKAAGSRCRKKTDCCSRKCQRHRCRCRAGTRLCGAACVDVKRDIANCGGCGRVCDGAVDCVNGECVCPSGRERCDAVCAAVQTDREHCGSCGAACDEEQDCQQGTCCDPRFHELESAERVVCCPIADICGTDVCCAPGDTCVNHTCCGPDNYLVCASGAGDCCPAIAGFQCCGTSCCEAPVQCCQETCCRQGTVCCPDDPGRCCTEENACDNGTCHCYADRFLMDGKCYARAGSGGGRFRRARGVL
ncbi:MAG: hypothetical protein U0031_06545 [Thermomicrobiales bacterium]